jgi:ATP-binding cassette subfamily F protein uup
MTPLIQIKNLSFSVGGPLLIEKANLVINPLETIGLVGRNGTGKSTFLKLLMGDHQPDDGEVHLKSGLKISQLIQSIPQDLHDSITTVIASGHREHGDILAEYFRQEADGGSSEKVLTEMTEHDLWGDINAAQTLVSRFELDPNALFSSLSGGMKRRVLLAKSLVNNPELLLLDEPTNHLDIETIEWLELFLKNANIALVIVSHDRAFLNKLCTRIVDIDRGKLVSWDGNFDQYLIKKEKALEEEERHNELFDKKLAQEEVWIRQGIKARRTRNEGRVRALKELRVQRNIRREIQGNASFKLHEQSTSGKRVIKLRNICQQYNDHFIINDFSCNIIRGDKIGIIGANGCGKSTLIKIITEQLQADSGTVKLGTNLEIAYLDQLRSDINENLSVLDNISGGRDQITINGIDRHIMSYVQEFLFSPEKARGPVTALSGGERNRLLLAKLFTKPFNLLILDEPTNDLDMETLELLENLLVEYKGTLLLVSHDRSFLDNVVGSTIVFEGTSKNPGLVQEYIGGYEDWLRQRKNSTAKEKKTNSEIKEKNSTATPTVVKKKLSYKEQRELDTLPEKIETLEAQIEKQSIAMNDPGFFKQSPEVLAIASENTKQWQEELNICYRRWEELD